MNNLLLGFLDICEPVENDIFLGALLLTTEYGIPLEFRCTHSIKPDLLQKGLYGNTLKFYIGSELCGVPLVKSLQKKPDILIIRKEYLTNVGTSIELPIFLIKESGEGINVSENAILGQEDSYFYKERKMVLNYNPEKANVAHLKEALKAIGAQIDLIEPFERIEKAVKILGEKDEKYR